MVGVRERSPERYDRGRGLRFSVGFLRGANFDSIIRR